MTARLGVALAGLGAGVAIIGLAAAPAAVGLLWVTAGLVYTLTTGWRHREVLAAAEAADRPEHGTLYGWTALFVAVLFWVLLWPVGLMLNIHDWAQRSGGGPR